MKFFKKSDIYIIAAIIAVSLLSWGIHSLATKDDKPKAEIYLYSELVKTIDLSKGEDVHFSVEGEPDVVFHVTSDGKIRFEASDCPDKLCIKSGALSKPGQFAACLPNGLVLKIVGTKDDKNTPDIIIGSMGDE